MRIFYIQLFFSCAKPFSCVCTFGMFIEQNCFASIQNYFIHTPNVLCAYNIVACTNTVLYTYTMVKHTKCFLCEPDNFVNIKGFVGVEIGFTCQNSTSTSVPLNILHIFCVFILPRFLFTRINF